MRAHLERWWCRQFGHRWAKVQKEPVLGEFFMCMRCGRYFR